MKHKRNEAGFHHIFLLMVVIVLTVAGFAGWQVYKKNQSSSSANKLSAGGEMNKGCVGQGQGTITASPIALSDLLYIQPTGLEIGGHVTPIDHGYFYIKGASARPPTQAPVYSPFDGIITSVSLSVRQGGSGPNQPASYNDYALSVAATCNFRVRFSNMVKFSGGLAEKVGQLANNQMKNPQYTVKAGELIGYTGLPTAQGIDVWVEDDHSTLTGFINPAQYTAAESWKVHSVDLFDHTIEPLKTQLLALTLRDASPHWGKIDYDIDGKLIGTWFERGTGGYGGGMHGGEGYWKGHLSIVPDGNDPGWTDISFGSYQGQPQQFAVIGNTPDPAKVDLSTGLIKYQIGQIMHYSATTGEAWTGQTYVPHIRTKAGSGVMGTVLMQMTDKRTLKMEAFPGKTASQVSGFDATAKTYER
jgi:hypothetical protein